MTFGRLGFFYPVIRWFNEIFGTNIRIAFAVPGVVLATIFVTFPYVSREIIPVLNSLGRMRRKQQHLWVRMALQYSLRLHFQI